MSGRMVHVKAPADAVAWFLQGKTTFPVVVEDSGECGCCWGEGRDGGCSPHTLIRLDGWTADLKDRLLLTLLLEGGFMACSSDGDMWSEYARSIGYWVDWCPGHVGEPKVFAPHDRRPGRVTA